MVEENIKDLNWGQSAIAGSLKIIEAGLGIYVIVSGLRIVSSIPDDTTRIFALIVIMYMMLRHIRFDMPLVYDSKDGGLIRFN